MAALKILFVHQNFPGQFPHIVEALVKRGDKVAAIGSTSARAMPGVDLLRWETKRRSTPGILLQAAKTESDLIRAEAAAHAAMKFKADGFEPDLIIGHPGWGETIYLNEIFPRARQILFGEFFYRPHGQDLYFDKAFDKEDLGMTMASIAKNAPGVVAYTFADRIIVPTPFQASGFPKLYAPILRVLHEGVDLSKAVRKPGAATILPNGRILTGEKPVITFINRRFERVRGFHIFMRALPKLFAEVPDAEVIIVGSESGNLYGQAPPGGGLWKDYMICELASRLDMNRLHFVGQVPHQKLVDLMSMSWAHVYYTYPFVLSWSLVEAMACECLILGSDTAPVRDAVTDGYNGLLNDFFDVEALSDAMIRAAREPESFAAMRTAARESVFAKFDQEKVGVPGWLEEIDAVLASR